MTKLCLVEYEDMGDGSIHVISFLWDDWNWATEVDGMTSTSECARRVMDMMHLPDEPIILHFHWIDATAIGGFLDMDLSELEAGR